jgi:hypothetical protein
MIFYASGGQGLFLKKPPPGDPHKNFLLERLYVEASSRPFMLHRNFAAK